MICVGACSRQASWWLTWWRICLQCRRPEFNPWVRKIPWRREWLPTPVFLPGVSHGQRGLAGYSPWGHKESDTTEQLTLSPSLFHVPDRQPYWLVLLGSHYIYTPCHVTLLFSPTMEWAVCLSPWLWAPFQDVSKCYRCWWLGEFARECCLFLVLTNASMSRSNLCVG